ncbi:protein FAR1-RELATED SEQUENCE 5 [Citrus clementina]|nr:protein FAR1-RELATED SEQUENCE 5 [Citrus x clementina]
MVIKLCKAIKTVMSGCVHRLCCWNLERNAQANVKRNEFTLKFRQLMLNAMSIEEFDRDWFSVVYNLGLEQNPWVEKMYAKRRKWTEAYLKGTFFAGMRTTQRCENLNSYLRRFVEQKLKLYDFIRQIHHAMYCIRHKEVQDEYETNHTALVLTTHLQSIEKHASEIYTRNVLKWVRMEILGEATLIMLGCAKIANSNIYILTKFQHPE